MNTDRFLRLKEVLKLVPVHHSTIYRWIKQEMFPAPMKRGRLSFWRNSEIQEFISGQSHQIEA